MSEIIDYGRQYSLGAEWLPDVTQLCYNIDNPLKVDAQRKSIHLFEYDGVFKRFFKSGESILLVILRQSYSVYIHYT
jgi:hypothetical protein